MNKWISCTTILLLLTLLTGCTIVMSEPENPHRPDESNMINGSFQIGVRTDENGNQIIGIIGNQPVPEKTDPPQQPNTTEPVGCTDHSFGSWIITKPSNCFEEGSRVHSCLTCGHEETESIAPNEHNWLDADCNNPRRCSSCQTKEGSALGHTGGTATCDQKAVCTRCNDEYGSLKDHKLVDATCTSAEYCSVCNTTFGSELGHSYAGGECIRCGEKDPNKAEVGHFYMDFPLTLISGNGKITSATYETSGDTLYITINGQKTYSDGSLTIGWIVYGSGHVRLQDGDIVTPTYDKNETFSYTFAVDGVITSAHKKYSVWLGLPIIEY